MLTPPDICGSINGTTTVSVEMITQTSLCVNKKRDSLPVKAGCQDAVSYTHLDVYKRQISCVGNPDDRFSEDALRILRALRFASTYQFHIESETAKSIHKNRNLLRNIAPERIQSELCKLLMGAGVTKILLEYSDVIAVVIPEFLPCIGFEQNNRFHQYTVYEHIVRAVGNYGGDDLSVKIALLLHDIGKPQCYTEDENGGHFYGHAVPSTDIASCLLYTSRCV